MLYEVNDLFTKRYLADPHCYWLELRRQSAIVWSTQLKSWLITRHHAAKGALTHLGLATDVYAQFRPSPIQLPSSFELDTHRSHIFRMMVRSRLNASALPLEVISKSCSTVLHTIPLDIPFDFVTKYSDPLADLLAESLLGIATEKRKLLTNLLSIAEFDRDAVRRMVASEIAVDEILSEVRAHRESRGSDFLTRLAVSWEEEGGDDSDLVAFIAPFIFSLVQRIATRLVTHSALVLSLWPRLQIETRLGGYEGARGLVLETARWEPITQIIPRRAKETIVINGQSVEQDQTVLIVLTSACRDDDVYSRADSIDMGRQGNSLAFGYGLHSCLGRELAVTVAATAISQLIGTGNRIKLSQYSSPEYLIEFGKACTKLEVILCADG